MHASRGGVQQGRGPHPTHQRYCLLLLPHVRGSPSALRRARVRHPLRLRALCGQRLQREPLYFTLLHPRDPRQVSRSARGTYVLCALCITHARTSTPTKTLVRVGRRAGRAGKHVQGRWPLRGKNERLK
jgi:hypothetical protein